MQAATSSSRAGIGGPKTLEGKLRSSRNAVKHGLNSSQPVVLDFETPEAWEEFQASLVASLNPATAAERCLAELIALTMWRQRRIPIFEARLANARMQSSEGTWERFAHNRANPTEEALTQSLDLEITRALTRCDPETDQLIRYEAHLDRKLSRLFREFHQLQKLRNELTAAVDHPSANRSGVVVHTHSEHRPTQCDPGAVATPDLDPAVCETASTLVVGKAATASMPPLSRVPPSRAMSKTSRNLHPPTRV
jgi:hypothetical protein